MAGSARSELASSSPEGSTFTTAYPNGQRGSYSSANLERSGSFRESLENRVLASGSGITRNPIPSPSSEILPLNHYLMLEPLSLGDQKYTRSGELRKILGVSIEEQSFMSVQSKPLPPAASEELKRYRSSILDSSNRARERSKVLHESIVKLDRYRNLLSRKRQRNEIPSSEKSGGANSFKMGSQVHQNSSDLVTQRLEDRTKNIVPNRRIRSSVAEVRSEGRGILPLRTGTVVDKDKTILVDKDKSILRTCNGGLVPAEDKIRGLPTGGDGWEKKMKRKRSVGTVVTRTMDGDREFKQTMQQRLNNEPRPRSCDGVGFRPGSSNGFIGVNRTDSNSQVNGVSATRAVPRNELDSVSLLNDRRERSLGLDKERNTNKGGNKPSIREDSQTGSQSPLTKGKASRAPRTVSCAVMNSSSNIPRTAVGLDGWDPASCSNKIQSSSGVNNRKRPLPTGSPSPPVQWVGQRPQKICRTRRTNLVSPVSNHEEGQILPEGFSAPEVGPRLTGSETSGTLLSRGISNNTQHLKLKHENIPSPAALSESEESGAVENKPKERGVDNGEGEEDATVNAFPKVTTFMLPTKKNKVPSKDETGDGVRRQGRSGRGLAQSKVALPSTKEKVENVDTTKPLRSGRPGHDKSESKIGRPPSKKASDRKSFNRPGNFVNSGSSELTGESDDDREELIAAAKSARSASYRACSGPFWEKMETVFSLLSSEEIDFLKQQVTFTKELDESLHNMPDASHNLKGDLECLAVPSLRAPAPREIHGSQQNSVGPNKYSGTVSSVVEPGQVDAASEKLETERWFEKIVPLSQRLLSAFILEDDTELSHCRTEQVDASVHFTSDYSSYGARGLVDCDNKELDMLEAEFESEMDFMTHKKCSRDSNCNGYTASSNFRMPNIHKFSFSNELLEEKNILPYLKTGVHSECGQNNVEMMQNMGIDYSSNSPIECQYEHLSLDDKILMELQSIGLFPDTVPDLTEGEGEEIDKNISDFKMGFYQQVRRTKEQMCFLDKAIQNTRESEERKLEHIAMNKLVEMAYKKYMGGRGSSKSGVNKISKQAALAFAKRTLARCLKLENTGRSCFSDPTFRDIFSAPLQAGDAKAADDSGPGTSVNLHAGARNNQPDVRSSASGLSSITERHEPNVHKLDRVQFDTFHGISHLSEQHAKHESFSNRGKKREVLLDDVVISSASRIPSTIGNTLLGGVKGKRSERDRDQNRDAITRNSGAKAGRPSLGNLRGERKTKSKPKQKTAQLSTSGNGLLGRPTEASNIVLPLLHDSCEIGNNGRGRGNQEVGVLRSGDISHDLSKDMEETVDFANLPLHAIDSIAELSVSDELGGQGQDIGSWLNVDEDALQDNDLMGLEIPMDDLSELNMNF